ncbi:hypothetical protein JKP88DRAFT_287594 [Tribonema minus]|uniref:Uncharacterized protein n=1 Tax=Tribonema minus TaxID=303371 RepID=A0A836CLZ8_9STRA|nr:hypothetical protein JKP88DRAFT_287594 [Tribonema minus]
MSSASMVSLRRFRKAQHQQQRERRQHKSLHFSWPAGWICASQQVQPPDELLLTAKQKQPRRKGKAVKFCERVRVILIPAKEEVEHERVWWTSQELHGFRCKFYKSIKVFKPHQEPRSAATTFDLSEDDYLLEQLSICSPTPCSFGDAITAAPSSVRASVRSAVAASGAAARTGFWSLSQRKRGSRAAHSSEAVTSFSDLSNFDLMDFGDFASMPSPAPSPLHQQQLSHRCSL